jgi:hypothetical protein
LLSSVGFTPNKHILCQVLLEILQNLAERETVHTFEGLDGVAESAPTSSVVCDSNGLCSWKFQ